VHHVEGSVAGGVEQGVGPTTQVRFEAGDGAGGEAPVDQAPQAVVLGSSVWLSMVPADRSSLMAVPPAARIPPRSEENVAASRWTASTSAWRLTTQNPSPSGVRAVGSCQCTGSWSRSQVKTS
jgi:hypothetical protein